jgi:nicotinamide riboside kinase
MIERRADAPVRIVLTGSECTGKSTLAKALAEHYGVGFAREYLREYFEKAGGRLCIDDTVPIAEGQLQRETLLEQRGSNPLICDTDALSSVIYANHYFGSCPQRIEAIFASRPRTHYLLCHIDVPWRADGQRDRPEQREHMHGLFASELDRRGFAHTLVRGSLAQRLATAMGIVDRLLSA